jgi:hypothetical protein
MSQPQKVTIALVVEFMEIHKVKKHLLIKVDNAILFEKNYLYEKLDFTKVKSLLILKKLINLFN